MKKDTKEAIGGAIMLIMLIAIFVAGIAMVIKVWSPTDFNNKEKFSIEEYCVVKGDSAWDIYSDTCSSVSWEEWCDFVRDTNNISSLGSLQVGQMLLIPVPNE